MDEYPKGSLDPSIPLLLTLGVAGGSDHGIELDTALREQGVLIRSEAAPLDSEQALGLLRYIQDHDLSRLPPTSPEPIAALRYRFRVRTAERSLLLPPRHARLPDGADPPASPAALHSPFSPLSTVSKLYPDGLIDTKWLQKHQALVPALVLCFYTLVSDPTQATLCDNQIKSDLNNIKGLLSQSGYKTRLAVVLLSDQHAPSVEGVQERLENLRKGCGIDSKALFLVPPNESTQELGRMAENMLSTLYPLAVEYYRDLGRHARKKRGRGIAPQPTIPPTSGTSQTLSLAGWNVRYDFKSAIFAEFRSEYENALRSYDQAYDGLLSSELLEVIPSWSPRWNEARFLADVIAIRGISCLLFGGQHSTAARRWQLHRDKVAGFVDRHGRGTKNYGWKAWESRWAVVMANLIERTVIPGFEPQLHQRYLQPEKVAMGERLQPFEFLHHPGYWYRLAAQHLYGRRALARAMPDDDRSPPSSSPASHVASKAFTYDTYMCPEPHEEYPLNDAPGTDYGDLIVDNLTRARSAFLERQQVRFAAELSLECARELTIRRDWKSIVELLRPLWKNMSFRTEGWYTIAEELSWILRGAAAMVGEAALVVAIDWELLNRNFTKRTNWHYDISKSLDGISPKSRPHVYIEDGQTLSFISASFIFKDEEGKAGQSANGQLTLKSSAHQGSAPIRLNSVQVELNGSVNRIIFKHQDDADPQQKNGNTSLSAMSLSRITDKGKGKATDPDSLDEEQMVILQGDANLTLAPGQVIVLGVQVPLREPGETCAVSLTMNLHSESFDLDQYQSFQQGRGASIWYLSASRTKRVARENPLAVKVLPRPPQMEIVGLTWKDQYYTDEPIALEFEIINEEDVDAPARLDAILVGPLPPVFIVEVPGQDETSSDGGSKEESRLSGLSLGAIESSKSIITHVRVPPIPESTQYNLTLKLVYFLSTNPGTPITQTAVFQLNIVNPFEANYDLLPRVHPDPWPSLFDPEGVRDPSEDDTHILPKGLCQTYSLVTRYASFASEDLRVHDVDIRVQTSRSVRVHSTRTLPASPNRIVKPKTIEDAAFDITSQKHTLDDRSQSTLDVSLVIKWSRLTSSTPNTTTLPVPRFVLFGTEPRVLASASHIRLKESPKPLIILLIIIENASNHFLTFGLSMEPSDEFAFSGPKQTTLHLLPVSRRSATYRLLPLASGSKTGGWIKPGLVVRDKYFQKVLRVIPTEGMKLDKDGAFLVWVPPEEEEGSENGEGSSESE
ncbi:Gryzun, putative trafficking through golgi-domain-containing protein [Cercophora newfieldiana]|uniref:Gryzun, putative trafficking through golgi-domain-containing protein n=1 Tax=Cercophora newfieldiana TaxID=92897 RepID=A0AA39XVL3_9PEZI|nr:Gryzun, putative trafficking through golgi-domain-containing protein [Cercophora newfieldiana]